MSLKHGFINNSMFMSCQHEDFFTENLDVSMTVAKVNHVDEVESFEAGQVELDRADGDPAKFGQGGELKGRQLVIGVASGQEVDKEEGSEFGIADFFIGHEVV